MVSNWYHNDTMMTPVRITEENYAGLVKDAEDNHRSVIAQLNYILEDYFTIRMDKITYNARTIIPPSIKGTGFFTPMDIAPGEYPKNSSASAQEEFVVDENFVPPDELPPLPVEPIVTPLSDESTVILDNEKSCCKRNAPCVHWMFDGVNELWKNTLSGRIKEL